MDMKIKVAGTENKRSNGEFFPAGNWTFEEKFDKWPLDYRWIAMRGPREEFIVNAKNGIVINPMANRITDVAPISALFHRQQHSWFTAETQMIYAPKTPTAEAGVCLYQGEKFNYTFVVALNGKDTVIRLVKTQAPRGNMNTGDANNRKAQSTIIAEEKINAKLPVNFKVVGKGSKVEFYYSNGAEEKNLGGVQSTDILTTDVAGGFTGNLIGLYATK